MSDFKTKMHQIRLRLGLRPKPRWGSYNYSAPQTPSLDLSGHTSKGRDGRGRVGTGRDSPLPSEILNMPLHTTISETDKFWQYRYQR